MASNRKTTLFTRQDGTKTTVPPNHINEMSHDQIDMVSGSFGVIANNTNLNVFANNFADGTSPILADKNSKIEVEQSLSTGKNNEIDNSKFVVALENNNIQVDDKSETNSKTRITRKSATDISNSTNFPSPNPGYVDIYKTVNEQNPALINTDIIAAAEVVNNGIDTEMAALSAGILLQDTTIDLSTTYKQFYNVDISKSGVNFNKFLNNLPRDLNGKTLTFKFNNNFTDTCIFNRFYGGTIDLQGIYAGLIEFTECQNIIFNNFTANNTLTFTDCDNVVLSGGTYKQLNVYRSKCHCIKSSFNGNPIIADNEGAQVLFDQCTLNNNKLITFSKGSQVSSTNHVSTTQELLNKNFTSETKAGMNSNKDIENLTNHFHITAEHINNTYPIGSVYGWPRAYTRGDIKRAIISGNLPNNYQVSVLPTISGLTSNYLPSGDLPLDMIGSYVTSPYTAAAQNYTNIHKNVTPIGIQTSSNKNSFCVFDWYKLYKKNHPESAFDDNYGINSINNELTSTTVISNSVLKTETDIQKSALIFENVYFCLNHVDVYNVHASKTAESYLTYNITNAGFSVMATSNNSGPGVEINYSCNLTGLSSLIPPELQKFVKCEYFTNTVNSKFSGENTSYDENTNIGCVYGCNSFNKQFSVGLNFTWVLKNVVLYIPYISVTGKIDYIAVSLQNFFKNVDSDDVGNIYTADNTNKNYGGGDSSRYNYDHPIQYPNISSFIIISPTTRNAPLLTQDDWYLFSDTIMNVKTGTSYKSKSINNYYDEYTRIDDLSIINNTNVYFIGDFNNNIKVVHNIAKTSGIKNSASGTYSSNSDFNTFISGISVPVSGYYALNGELYLTDDKTTTLSTTPNAGMISSFNAYDRATFSAVNTLGMQISYDFNNVPQYVENNRISNYVILPLEARTKNKNTVPTVESTTLKNTYISKYETDNETNIINSPFRFHPQITHMIVKHNLMKSCEDFLSVINGINIANNMFDFIDNRGTTKQRIRSLNTTWPPVNNYLNGMTSDAKNIFNGTVGAAYPMISGEISEISGRTYSFYNGRGGTYNIPWSNAPSTLCDPKYFGIPYIITGNNMQGIRYSIDNASQKSCAAYLGGQPNKTDFIYNAMPMFNKFNIGNNENFSVNTNNTLLMINNLYNIYEDLVDFYRNNNDGNINLTLTYDREFYCMYNTYNCDIYYSESSISDFNHIGNILSGSTSGVAREEFSKLSSRISSGHNDGIIQFAYSGRGQSFSHYFTNITDDNYQSIIENISTSTFLLGEQKLYYDTKIQFDYVWDWNIFFQTYMHKLYFVVSKLNRFYKSVFSNNNTRRKNIALNLSFNNIIKFSAASLFFGNNTIYHNNKSNIDFTDINNDINDFISLVGQMYYPVGKFDSRTGYIIMNNTNNNSKESNEFFTDRNNWAKNSFNMNSILSNDNYCYRKE